MQFSVRAGWESCGPSISVAKSLKCSCLRTGLPVNSYFSTWPLGAGAILARAHSVMVLDTARINNFGARNDQE